MLAQLQSMHRATQRNEWFLTTTILRLNGLSGTRNPVIYARFTVTVLDDVYQRNDLQL